MSFFGLFKSKQQKELDEMMSKVFARIFPGGEADVLRDCKRIDALTGGRIPPDKLRGYVTGCKTLLNIAREHDEGRFVSSFQIRADGKITVDQAYDVYVYLEGEASYYDRTNLFLKNMGSDTSAFKDYIGNMPWTYSVGTRTDTIPGGFGEYGLVQTNPIPTVSVRGSESYLASLRYGGQPIEANRMGSTSSKVTPGQVDIYQLSFRGRDVASIYICPYHKWNSKKAPKGFSLTGN